MAEQPSVRSAGVWKASSFRRGREAENVGAVIVAHSQRRRKGAAAGSPASSAACQELADWGFTPEQLAAAEKQCPGGKAEDLANWILTEWDNYKVAAELGARQDSAGAVGSPAGHQDPFVGVGSGAPKDAAELAAGQYEKWAAMSPQFKEFVEQLPYAMHIKNDWRADDRSRVEQFLIAENVVARFFSDAAALKQPDRPRDIDEMATAGSLDRWRDASEEFSAFFDGLGYASHLRADWDQGKTANVKQWIQSEQVMQRFFPQSVAAAAPAPQAAKPKKDEAPQFGGVDGMELAGSVAARELPAQLKMLGFSDEETEAVGKVIPANRKKNNPIGWCLDWRDGCLDSMQCWEAGQQECMICYCETGQFKMNCDDGCCVCRDCLASGLSVKIKEQKVEDMQCPMDHKAPTNGGSISPACVKAALVHDGEDKEVVANDAKMHMKYLDLAARKEAEKWGGQVVFCPSCDWYGIVTQEEDKYSVKCQNEECPSQEREEKGHFCGLCFAKPHIKQKDQDISCEDLAKWKAQNDGSLAMLAELMKKEKMQTCPKCGMPGKLTSGCKWVMCPCKQKYCYHCGRWLQHDRQHYSHWVDGPFGNKCVGGRKDKEGFTADLPPCPDCKGWSFGTTECKKCCKCKSDKCQKMSAHLCMGVGAI